VVEEDALEGVAEGGVRDEGLVGGHGGIMGEGVRAK
jgi:hypothetical protein